MSFTHEKLDVYCLAIEYVAWAFALSGELKGNHRHAKDQLLRASQSIPLNIAEGNAKASEGDRRRFFEIARGSVLECAAIQDVLVATNGLDMVASQRGKAMLDRIAAMLTRLGGRGYSVKEDGVAYGDGEGVTGCPSEFDSDTDSDTDSDRATDRFRR